MIAARTKGLLKNYQKHRILAGRTKAYLSKNKDYAQYSVLSVSPPVFFANHWLNEDLRLQYSMDKIFNHLKQDNACFLYNWCWNIDEPHRVQHIKCLEEIHIQKYPGHRFIHLCNTKAQFDSFQEGGLNAVFCNQNAFLDENIFKPLPEVSKKYDAIYDARFKDYKRHFLASEIKSLALLYEYTPGIDNRDYVEKIRQEFAHAKFVNHADGPYQKLNPEEVNLALNENRVGLCLSATEGAMYASMQYLLCGIPVVSTKSKGGRDVFFDDEVALIVDDNPAAVKAGVEQMIARNPKPEVIRTRTLEKICIHRQKLISVIQSIYNKEGCDRDFASEWQHLFFHKLCKFQKHSEVIEQLEKNRWFSDCNKGDC